MYEDDFSHEIKASHRQGKMIMVNWDYLLDAPDNSCLYCLTDMQVRALLVVAEYLGWPSRYYSEIGTPINRDVVDALRGGVINALMTDRCTEIITKLDAIKTELDGVKTEVHATKVLLDGVSTVVDNTQTEVTLMSAEVTEIGAQQLLDSATLAAIKAEQLLQSASLALMSTAIAGIASNTTSIKTTVEETGADVDNIETIITDPVDGLAEVSEDVDAIELKVNKMQGQVTNITNNTIITLNFGVPDQTFTADSKDVTLTETYARYNALCSAIVNWIYAEGYAVMSALDAPATDLATIAAYIDAYANSLQYSMTGFLGSYTIAQIYAALNDTTAVNDVACVMINNLANLAPTSYSFSLAFAGYTPPAYPDHRKILYDTLVIAISDLNGWQTLASILEPAYEDALAANPTSFNCPPCGAVSAYCTIPQTWDFTLGQKTPWLIQRGQLVPGVGIVGQQIPGDLNFGLDVSISWPTPCTSILTHNIEIQRAKKSASGGNSWTLEWYYLLAGVETRYNQANISQTTAWPGIETGTVAVPTPPGGVGVYRFRFYTNTPYYGNATNQAADASKLTIFKTKT